MTEEWRAISRLPNYEVSDQGRIRHAKSKRVRKVILGKTGYSVLTAWDGTRRAVVTVHTLVLEAFVGPRPPGLECLHADEDKTNARLENLSWGTHAQNMRDYGAHKVRTRPPAALKIRPVARTQIRRVSSRQREDTQDWMKIIEKGPAIMEQLTEHQSASEPGLGKLYSKADLCELLGVKESWLNVEIAEMRIPHLRLGKRKFIRFTEDNIRDYLASREVGTLTDYLDR